MSTIKKQDWVEEIMPEIEKNLNKFFIKLLEEDFNNVDALLELKECAMNMWENKQLTDSEHCDIEAYLDCKLSLL